MMTKDNKRNFVGLKFNGKSGDFQRWKDAVLTHLTNKTNSCRVAEIKDKRPPPRLGYEDLLTRPIQVAELGTGVTAKELEQCQLEMAFLVEQESYLWDLFNQTLPHRDMAQLSTLLMSQTLEADFGKNNAMGMVDMYQEFEAVLEWLSPMLNRLGQEVLCVHLLPWQLLIGKILTLLPSHLWGPSVTFAPEEFTLEKVERALKAIFGNKSKTEIHPCADGSQLCGTAARNMKETHKTPVKRKQASVSVDDENACYYCSGADRRAGVGRGNIFSDGGPLKVQRMSRGKAQKATESKEVPVDAAALQRLNISDATSAASGKDESKALGLRYLPLTPRGTSPASPVVSSDPPSASDDDMHEFDGAKATPINT
ncbi:hypothetical protein GN958_ATG14371, partial [Phytophthora infestans]